MKATDATDGWSTWSVPAETLSRLQEQMRLMYEARPSLVALEAPLPPDEPRVDPEVRSPSPAVLRRERRRLVE